jgi:hypothetical protein
LPRDWHLIANPGTLPTTAAALVAHVLMTGEFQRPDEQPGRSANTMTCAPRVNPSGSCDASPKINDSTG